LRVERAVVAEVVPEAEAERGKPERLSGYL
jgi:hypothetical protein